MPGDIPSQTLPPTPRVYKYEIPIEDCVSIDLPAGAELLHVGVQTQNVLDTRSGSIPRRVDTPVLWARVDPSAKLVPHRFRVAGTGHPDAVGKYVGTAVCYGGSLVLHVFLLAVAD